MKVARSLERRLERLLESISGKVFSGRLHPAEMAGKVAREADLARFDHEAGPATANVYTIVVNPRDLSVEPATLGTTLAGEIDRYTAEEGLRLEGPLTITIETSAEIPPGTVHCHLEVTPGPPVPWAKLTSDGEVWEIGRNRVLIGRAPDVDVIIPADDISRRHALIWRQGGQAWVRDLGSANGTTLDGAVVGSEPAGLHTGSVLGFSGHRFRFIQT